MLNDWVVVRPEKRESVVGGIVIPDRAQGAPMKGEVLGVGEGRPDMKMKVKVGDRVMFPQNSGVKIEQDGVELHMIKHGDLFSILEED